jgi:DmsA/YnfE family anaerobic dimethyl sulfoxide reductase A subunit
VSTSIPIRIDGDEQVFSSTCAHNCGGRCIVRAHVRDGRIVGISTDDGPWTPELPALRACGRGMAAGDRVNRPDRLLYPQRRVGERGEGRFERCTWDEALDEVAAQMVRIRDQCGAAAILDCSRTGSTTMLHNRTVVARLLNMFGGCTELWGSLSNEAEIFAIDHTFGVKGRFKATGREGTDYVNSKLIIMWGWGPADGTFGTNTIQYLNRARQAGVKIVSVNPRRSPSLARMAERNYPIRPGTDTAMLLAMAWVMIVENLHDQAFLDRHTIGFDAAHLPPGAPADADFRSYVEGRIDGIPKTPRWAAELTGIPAEDIASLAREYATSKPSAIQTGYAPGRTAAGEQFHRAVYTLAAMAGYIGIPGGNCGSSGGAKHVDMGRLPGGTNPTGARVNSTQMADVILRGKAGGYPSDIKMVYSAYGNLLNQISNLNKNIEAYKKLEFVVVQDHFLTPTARFADILLPAASAFERNDIHLPWSMAGHYALYMQKAIEPMGECRTDYEICADLARRLGIDGFDAKSEDEWLREFVSASEIEDYESFKATGVARLAPPEHAVAFAAEIADPANHPFSTPTGKIEIYATRLGENPDPYGLGKISPIPTWVDPFEGVGDLRRSRYPLQVVTPHSKARTHSTHANQPMLDKLDPAGIWIHPDDAAARNISQDQLVRVFNDRGALVLPAVINDGMARGVVAMTEGRWYVSGPDGVDLGGNPNAVSLDRPSACGATTYNSCLVEAEVYEPR